MGRHVSLFLLQLEGGNITSWGWTSLILAQWTGQVLREPKIQRRWEGSAIWGTVELDGLGILDLFILACFGRVLLLGKVCLPRTFHLASDWSYLVLRKKNMITAETGSCELMFSLTCIDYNVRYSKSIHLNVPLERKYVSAVEYCQTRGKNNPELPSPPHAWMHMVPRRKNCFYMNNKNKEEEK